MSLPQVASETAWRAARDELLVIVKRGLMWPPLISKGNRK
jgi:hypothetical protein